MSVEVLSPGHNQEKVYALFLYNIQCETNCSSLTWRVTVNSCSDLLSPLTRSHSILHPSFHPDTKLLITHTITANMLSSIQHSGAAVYRQPLRWEEKLDIQVIRECFSISLRVLSSLSELGVLWSSHFQTCSADKKPKSTCVHNRTDTGTFCELTSPLSKPTQTVQYPPGNITPSAGESNMRWLLWSRSTLLVLQ